MKSTPRSVKAAVATLLLAVSVMGISVSASASAAGANQTFIFTHTGPFEAPDKVVALGPIDGVGIGIVEVYQPSPDGSTFLLRERLQLPGGSVTVTLDGHTQSTFDPRSCTVRSTDTGPWEIVEGSGTGRFAGATGGGTILTRSVLVLERTEEGCSQTGDLILISRWTGNVNVP